MEPELVPEPDRGRPARAGVASGSVRPAVEASRPTAARHSGRVQSALRLGSWSAYVANVGFHALSSLARLSSTMRRAFCVVERPRALHEDRPGAVRGHHDGLAVPDLRRGVLHPVPGEDCARLVDDTRPGGPDAAERSLQEVDAAGRMRPGLSVSGVSVSRGTTSTVTAVSAVGVGAASAPAGAVSRACAPVVLS